MNKAKFLKFHNAVKKVEGARKAFDEEIVTCSGYENLGFYMPEAKCAVHVFEQIEELAKALDKPIEFFVEDFYKGFIFDEVLYYQLNQ